MDYPEKLEEETGFQYNLSFYGNEYKHSINFAYGFYHAHVFPIKMHYHDFYEINIITNGFGRHYIESNSIYTNKCDVFFIPPNVKHGYFNINNLEIYNILVSPLFFDFFKTQTDKLSALNYMIKIEPELRIKYSAKAHIKLTQKTLNDILPYLKELHELRYKSITSLNANNGIIDSIDAIKMNALVLYCLACICNSASDETKQDTIVKGLIPSIEKIHRNFNENLSIANLAKECYMSENSFIKLFKKNLNITPNQYILNLKLDYAVKLLTTTDHNITFIAQECGFYDASIFIVKFKQKYKKTPNQYRNENMKIKSD